MAKKILDALCLAVLCTILALGLWPFHSPTNEVSWLRAGNGLSYARYGTAMSSGVFEAGQENSFQCRRFNQLTEHVPKAGGRPILSAPSHFLSGIDGLPPHRESFTSQATD